MSQPIIGLIGLAVMGENLALNIESKGFPIAVFNRTTAKTTAFVNGRAMKAKPSSTATGRSISQRTWHDKSNCPNLCSTTCVNTCDTSIVLTC